MSNDNNNTDIALILFKKRKIILFLNVESNIKYENNTNQWRKMIQKDIHKGDGWSDILFSLLDTEIHQQLPEGTLQTQPWFQNNGENDESGVVISECNSNQWSSLLLTINIKTERACNKERREAFILSTFPFQTLTNMVISSAWSLPCTNNHHGITQKVIYKHIPDFRSMVRVMRVLWMERIIRDHSCS